MIEHLGDLVSSSRVCIDVDGLDYSGELSVFNKGGHYWRFIAEGEDEEGVLFTMQSVFFADEKYAYDNAKILGFKLTGEKS